MNFEYVKIMTISQGLIDFYKNDKKYGKFSYENYLLELINRSAYFRKKSSYKEYFSPKTESNGECDCISETYSIDFKLLTSLDTIPAIKNTSFKITEENSIVYIGKSKSKEEHYHSIYHALEILKDTSLEKELPAELKDFKPIIENIFKILDKKKNILFFIPDIFTFRIKEEEICSEYHTLKFLEEYMKPIFNYRANTSFETYISFIHGSNLIIATIENDDIKIISQISFIYAQSINEYLHKNHCFSTEMMMSPFFMKNFNPLYGLVKDVYY